MKPRSLLVEVRFHEGRYHGEGDRFNGGGHTPSPADADGWPPSPGRLFQALVAAAARGARLRDDDRAALEWLEKQAPPRVAAPPARRGKAVKLYVPNNDLDQKGGDPGRISEIRTEKWWRPWFFDHEVPVLYVWDIDSAGVCRAERICTVAIRLYQLGRGIDMAWAGGRILDRNEANVLLESHPGQVRTSSGSGVTAALCQGTLDSLVWRYRENRKRLSVVCAGRSHRQLFTKPPKAVFDRIGYDSPARRQHFDLRNSQDEFVPRPLYSVAPLVTGLLREAARRLQDAFPDRHMEFERLIIGRGAGPSDLSQRMRLLPVPSIGTEHADLSVRRVVVEVPAACPFRVDDLEWAFAGLRLKDLRTGENLSARLTSTEDSGMASRFAREATDFWSITPVALSVRVPRRHGTIADADTRVRQERRVAGSVVQALRHAGIHTKPTDIRVQREPFHRRGALAGSFALGSRFSRAALWHVRLRFRKKVPGPLVIGNGRFCGLGLMEPGR